MLSEPERFKILRPYAPCNDMVEETDEDEDEDDEDEDDEDDDKVEVQDKQEKQGVEEAQPGSAPRRSTRNKSAVRKQAANTSSVTTRKMVERLLVKLSADDDIANMRDVIDVY